MELLWLSGRVCRGAIETRFMLMMFLAFKLSFDADIVAFFVSQTILPNFPLWGTSKYKIILHKPAVDMELLWLSRRVCRGATETRFMLMMHLAFKLSFDAEIAAFFVSPTILPNFPLWGTSKYKIILHKPAVDMELLRLSGRVFHGAIESHLMLMFLAFKLSFDTDILAFFVSATLMPIFFTFWAI
jgi:hypothetical protein